MSIVIRVNGSDTISAVIKPAVAITGTVGLTPAESAITYVGDGTKISVSGTTISAVTGVVDSNELYLVTSADIHRHVEIATSGMVTANDEAKSKVTGDVLVWNNSVPEWQRGTVSAGTGISLNRVGNDIEIVNTVTDTNTHIGNSDLSLDGVRSLNTNGYNFYIKDGAVAKLSYIDADDELQLRTTSVFTGKTAAGVARFQEAPANGTEYIGIKAPDSISSSVTFTLPDADGSTGQFMKTDGSGNLSFDTVAIPSRGGVYSYSGFATNRTIASEYYQWSSATATSSSTTMLSSSVGQGISHGTYGAAGAVSLSGLDSTDTVTYSITLKIATSNTCLVQVLSPVAGQFGAASAVVFASGSEQTIVLSPTAPTDVLSQANALWYMGFQITPIGATGTYRISDFSITVS